MHMKFEIVITKANSSYAPETMPPKESRYRKIQYGSQVDILKVILLKIIMLLSIGTNNMHMNNME